MKRNAMFRIALWGTILFVLLALFFFLLYTPVGNRRMETEPIAETMIPVTRDKVESVDISSGNAITKSNLNVRRSPSPEAEVVAFAEEGTVLKILCQEGDDVPVFQPIMVIGKAGEDYSEALKAATPEAAEAAPAPQAALTAPQ